MSRSPNIPGQSRRLLSVKISEETYRALAASGHPCTLGAQILEEWASSVAYMLAQLAAAEGPAPDQA